MNVMSPNYIGTVPNDSDLAPLLSLLRSVLPKGFGIRPCGRNPNRKQFYSKRYIRHDGTVAKDELQHDLPLKYATSVALYLRSSNTFDYVVPTRRKAARKIAKKVLEHF